VTSFRKNKYGGSIRVLVGIFGGDVPPASPNPDPISDQKMPFPTPVFRPGLKNPYQFSDLSLHVIKEGIYLNLSEILRSLKKGN